MGENSTILTSLCQKYRGIKDGLEKVLPDLQDIEEKPGEIRKVLFEIHGVSFVWNYEIDFPFGQVLFLLMVNIS